jgi:hypothetical protein
VFKGISMRFIIKRVYDVVLKDFRSLCGEVRSVMTRRNLIISGSLKSLYKRKLSKLN